MRSTVRLVVFCSLVMLYACWMASHHTPMPYVEHHPDGYAADRSSCWTRTRNAYIARFPVCEACGTRTDLNVHHIIPFRDSPELECDPRNLITLCREHHLSVGHYCVLTGKRNWATCSNPNVRDDARYFRQHGRLPERLQPKTDPRKSP